MLTKEENERLTRVGPGTPCGELLRRYWQPVSLACELTEERPLKRITILGEELVLYRATDGTYGLLAEHCPHRGASLYYGFLEGAALRCPYHGWLFDAHGRCLEQPFEPAQSMMKHTLRHPAYPVRELGGLLFAYMGPPDRQPLLPNWDILVNPGRRTFIMYPPLACNWLQCQENTADVTHTYFLHGHMMATKGLAGGGYYYRPFAQYGFQPFPWGLLKDWRCEGPNGGYAWGNLLIFPNMLRLATMMHWRVPVDDTHTLIFWLNYRAPGATRTIGELPHGDGPEPEVTYPGPLVNERGEYPLDTFGNQDAMAWETAGPIFDRTREHLGASDAGIVMFRQMLAREIEKVERGEDPMGLVRDPAANAVIDLREWFNERDPVAAVDVAGAATRARPAAEVFDDRHIVVDVPYGAARPRPESGRASSAS